MHIAFIITEKTYKNNLARDIFGAALSFPEAPDSVAGDWFVLPAPGQPRLGLQPPGSGPLGAH